VLADRGRRSPQPAFHSREAKRQARYRVGADDGVVELLVIAASSQLRMQRCQPRIDRRRGRYALMEQQVDSAVEPLPCRPRGQLLIELLVGGAAAGE